MTVFGICLLVLILALGGIVYRLWRSSDKLMEIVSRLTLAQSETEKYVKAQAENIGKLEDKLNEIPTEQLRDLYDKESAFQEGLSNIMNYGLKNYGLNKGGSGNE